MARSISACGGSVRCGLEVTACEPDFMIVDSIMPEGYLVRHPRRHRILSADVDLTTPLDRPPGVRGSYRTNLTRLTCYESQRNPVRFVDSVSPIYTGRTGRDATPLGTCAHATRSDRDASRCLFIVSCDRVPPIRADPQGTDSIRCRKERTIEPAYRRSSQGDQAV